MSHMNALQFLEGLFNYSTLANMRNPDSISKARLLELSPNIKNLESIWNYLKEVKVYMHLEERHRNMLQCYDFMSVDSLNNIYNNDCEKILLDVIPNSSITIENRIESIRTTVSFPPIIYDFIKWAWIVSVYNLVKNNKTKEIINNKNSFIFNVPYGYFSEKYTKSRLMVEKAQLEYCCKIGFILEKFFPDVYKYLNVGLNYKYVPDIKFAKYPTKDSSSNVCSFKVVDTLSLNIWLIVAEFTLELHNICNFIYSAKKGCIEFVKEFKMLPTEKVTKLIDELKEKEND